tara:strand:- start:3682 stop:3990 length:309 start_codon:yes stop_codon:yes gene_type:complete
MSRFIKRLIVKRVAKLIANLDKQYKITVTTQNTSPGWNLFLDIGEKRRIIFHDVPLSEQTEIQLYASWFIDIPFIDTPKYHTSYTSRVRRGGSMVEYNPRLA